jgi:glutathione S-transferase
MKVIKLYDFKSSPNCQRVKVVLAEKNLPYEVVPIDLRKQEQKTPEYLKLNPYGKVPVLTDDDTVLYESCIINEYLDEKYPNPPLMPKDLSKKAKARILIDYGFAHFDSPYQKLRMELAKDPKEQNQQVIDGAKNDLKKLLQRFENEIGDQQYLIGDFSLVDADLIPRFTRLEGFGVLPDPSLPRLGKYMERMKARPSVKAIL